jgi:hypothetical protein
MINMSATSARKILILAANPTNSPRLRLDEEFREIDEGLKRSLNRDKFELTAKWAVTSRDFYRHILEIKPHIIHFSGHGAGEDGIVLEGEDGKAQLVPTDALASLFKLFAGKGLELVLFNACFSEVQADAIVRYIPYVTGMTKEIGDKAAISFAVAFYDALGAGHEIEFAFDLACTVIHMRGIPEHLTPVLKKNVSVDYFPSSSSPSSTSTSNEFFKKNKQIELENIQKDIDNNMGIINRLKENRRRLEIELSDAHVESRARLERLIAECNQEIHALEDRNTKLEEKYHRRKY